MVKKEGIHDKLVRFISDRMSSNGYSKVIKHRDYFNPISLEEGEFDVLGMKAKDRGIDYAVIVEIKTTKNGRSYNKAIRQLEKDCRKIWEYYGSGVRCFKLIVYRNKHRLKNDLPRPYCVEWIR